MQFLDLSIQPSYNYYFVYTTILFVYTTIIICYICLYNYICYICLLQQPTFYKSPIFTLANILDDHWYQSTTTNICKILHVVHVCYIFLQQPTLDFFHHINPKELRFCLLVCYNNQHHPIFCWYFVEWMNGSSLGAGATKGLGRTPAGGE